MQGQDLGGPPWVLRGPGGFSGIPSPRVPGWSALRPPSWLEPPLRQPLKLPRTLAGSRSWDVTPWASLTLEASAVYPDHSLPLKVTVPPGSRFPELSVSLGFPKESESGPWSPAAVFCWDPAAQTPSEAGTGPASTVEGGKRSSGGQRWPSPSPAPRGAGQNARARSPSLEADCR